MYGFDINRKAVENAEKLALIKKLMITLTLVSLMFLCYVCQPTKLMIYRHLK
jgi:hypothetical protein